MIQLQTLDMSFVDNFLFNLLPICGADKPQLHRTGTDGVFLCVPCGFDKRLIDIQIISILEGAYGHQKGSLDKYSKSSAFYL